LGRFTVCLNDGVEQRGGRPIRHGGEYDRQQQRRRRSSALCSNVEGDQSVASAFDALRNQNPVGNADMNNVAVGYQAALCTTTGCHNTAVGACALRQNTTAIPTTLRLGSSLVALDRHTPRVIATALGFLFAAATPQAV
jgi:hypothetical protein